MGEDEKKGKIGEALQDKIHVTLLKALQYL